MKNCIKLLISILLVYGAFICRAQQNDTLEIQRTKTGNVNYARFKTNSARKMQSDTLFLKSILKMKNDDGFKSILESNDELGFTHKKFQQYYKGIKVENALYLIHGKDGIIETINGDFQSVNIPSVTPSINELQALGKALDFVNSKKYKWEDEAFEKFIKQRENNPVATYFPKGELVIAKDYLKGGVNFKLAWKFTISSLDHDNEQLIYVDAITGEVIGNTPLILDANTTGMAQTRYSQTQVITCDSYLTGTNYRLSEIRNTTTGHSTNIHTWNCLNASNYTNAVEFSNNNTNWVTGSWPAITQDQVALDAHWGEERVIDYWSTVHLRNSLNNLGIDIVGYVHYYNPNYPQTWPNNAQWDGVNHAMRYGNGDGVTLNPLTALDVVAHEMGHGINQYTAYLHSATGNQENDALNEGFSDIWGACIEHWAAPTKQMWLMGEEIFIPPTTYNCIRNLQDPMSSTASEGPHPNTYHGTNWRYDGEPHCNSTVLSHWFYLLSQGGTGWNNGLTSHAPVNNGYQWNVNPIGVDAAQRIAYRAESQYLVPTDNYAAARIATISAAIDLFCEGSDQVNAVRNAWYAVGVGTQALPMTLTGPSPLVVCSSGATFTVNNANGCTVNWTCSSNLSFDHLSGNPKSFSAISSGTGWVQATINLSNYTCGQVVLPQLTVWVGTPAIYQSSIYNLQDMGYSNYYKILSSSGNYPYAGSLTANTEGGSIGDEWSFYANIPRKNIIYWNASSSYVGVAAKTNNAGEILKYTSSNTCGSSQALFTFFTGDITPPPPPLVLNPNPAGVQTEVSIPDENTAANETATTDTFSDVKTSSAVSTTSTYTLTVLNSNGVIAYTTQSSDKKITVPTSSFINGLYVVVVTDGSMIYRGNLLVSH